MKQCLHCGNRLFFKPLDSETYTCCSAWGETVKDISLRTGVSPVIQKYGIEGKLCEKFKTGESVCQASDDDPFVLHPIRLDAEMFLFEKLSAR